MLRGEEAGRGEGFEVEAGLPAPKAGCTRARGSAVWAEGARLRRVCGRMWVGPRSGLPRPQDQRREATGDGEAALDSGWGRGCRDPKVQTPSPGPALGAAAAPGQAGEGWGARVGCHGT